jgi:hypothetical protein
LFYKELLISPLAKPQVGQAFSLTLFENLDFVGLKARPTQNVILSDSKTLWH